MAKKQHLELYMSSSFQGRKTDEDRKTTFEVLFVTSTTILTKKEVYAKTISNSIIVCTAAVCFHQVVNIY